MPCDAYLISPNAVTVADIIRAGATINAALTVRTLHSGSVAQLVDENYEAVVSITHSRLVLDGREIARLVPKAPVSARPAWLAEALIPWDNESQPGIAILSELAMITRSALLVEDST
ncbi:MAG: hypothetical protein ACRCSP_09570 [Rhodoglobus sp.]